MTPRIAWLSGFFSDTPLVLSSRIPADDCITPPLPTDSPQPGRPKVVRPAGREVAIVPVVVGSNRSLDVTEMRLISSAFDELAMEAGKRRTHCPITGDGKPVAIKVNHPVSFRLY
ncbi:MAG: hypothetical protein ABSD75_15405 [Terriglobales bacterium]|jgi:hypothetical protein